MPRFRSHKARFFLAAVALLLCGVGTYYLCRAVWAHRQLAAANEALERYDYRMAAGILRSYLLARPGDASARLLAAQTFRRQGDFAEARRQLQQAEKDGAPADAVAAERQLLAIQSGNLAGANGLVRYCEEHPDSPGAALSLEVLIEGSIHGVNRALGRWAIDLWLERRKGMFDQVKGLVWRGQLHELADDLPGALADYKGALELAPDNLPARLHLAEALIRDEPSTAAPQMAWLREHYPDLPEVQFLSARLARRLGKPEEAARLLDQLLAATPNNFTALVERGRVALDQHRCEEAERFLLEALKMEPNKRDVYLALGDCMRQAGRTEEVKRYQNRVKEIDAQLEKVLGAMNRQ